MEKSYSPKALCLRGMMSMSVTLAMMDVHCAIIKHSTKSFFFLRRRASSPRSPSQSREASSTKGIQLLTVKFNKLTTKLMLSLV